MRNLIWFLFCLHVIESYSQIPYQYYVPEVNADGWETSHLTTLQIDTSGIYHLFGQLHQGPNKVHSVLLVKNDQLVLEDYFNGAAVDQPHDLRSATKSIRAILMGIAIDKGFVKSVDDPILDYLEQAPLENLDDRKKEITIKHLLTMSSGLECNDWDKKSKGQEDKVYRKPDWIQYTLDLPVVHEPGEVANYCSMGAILIAEIIAQASGVSIDEFADRYLFAPLGIKNYYWGHTSSKKVIPSGKRIYMTSRDMAKIGQLVLNRGKWKGEQIVSSAWLEAATMPQVQITGLDYGYFWWTIPFQNDDETVLVQTATGNGGQYIMVVPDRNLVAVFTGGAYNSSEDKLPFMIMNKVFLPAFKP